LIRINVAARSGYAAVTRRRDPCEMQTIPFISPALTKPKLRGWSHLLAFFFAVAGAAELAEHTGPGATSLAAIYGASLAGLLGTSALYHCPEWSLPARRVLRRFDHSGIFVLIAGTFTPLAHVLDSAHAHWLLGVAWAAALLGVARAMFWPGAPKKLVAIQAVLTGWLALAFAPALVHALDGATLALLALGGLLYSAGAAIYAFRRPNPWPRVFGFHEIFHLLVIAAAVTHFIAVWRVLVPMT
jgi:hemolysin III